MFDTVAATCCLGHYARIDARYRPLTGERECGIALFPTLGCGGVVELTDGRRHSQDIRVARLGGIAAGEIGDPLQPVPHRVWMNEQLSGTGLNRAATI